MLGRRFGPYEVTRELGSGGMGSVYLAERVDRQFHRQVAIKLLRPETTDRMSIERFRTERETLAALDHPNIVKLLDGGVTEEGFPYLVMDYVEGMPIHEYSTGRTLSFHQRLRLFLQVADGVHYAHRHLVVHRDIKPGNILVTAEGVAKLLDFGIARLIRGSEPGVTQMAQVFQGFTLKYASPEQVRGGAITVAVDVYALGVVLYELLTGRWPYPVEDPNEVAMAYAICEGEPLRGQLDADIDAVVLKAIEKRPADRYGSVADLAEDVRRHLEKRPVLARPQTIGYRFGRFAARNRGLVAAGALAALSLLGGLTGVLWQSHIANQQRTLAERRFEGLRQLLGTFLFDVHDAIRDLPGSMPARTMLIDKASQYLKWLSEQAQDDVNLKLDLADSYIKLADVAGNPYENNAGRTKEALEGYAKARQIAESVLAGDPKHLRARRYVALAQLKHADMLAQTGLLKEAVDRAKQALAVFQQIAAAQPDSIQGHVDVAVTQEALADLSGNPGLASLNDRKAALENLQAALGEWRQVLRMDARHVRARRAQGILRMKMGDLHRAGGDAERALNDYLLASADLEALWNDTRREELRRVRGLIWGKIGHAKAELGDSKGALQHYQDQIRLFEEQWRADSNDQRAMMDLASAYKNSSDASSQLGDASGAGEASRKSLELLDKLAAADPGNTVVQERLAMVLLQVAEMEADRKLAAEARQLAGRGLAILKKLADRAEAAPASRINYAEALLTCPVAGLRNAADALEYAEAGAPAEDIRELDILAQAQYANGQTAKAIETLERTLAKLPQGQKSHLREVVENRLLKYRSGQPPPAPMKR